jgi:Na+/melibiose symporter-like transporter
MNGDQEFHAAAMMVVWLIIFAIMMLCVAIGKYRAYKINRCMAEATAKDQAVREKTQAARELRLRNQAFEKLQGIERIEDWRPDGVVHHDSLRARLRRVS